MREHLDYSVDNSKSCRRSVMSRVIPDAILSVLELIFATLFEPWV